MVLLRILNDNSVKIIGSEKHALSTYQYCLVEGVYPF